MTKQQFWNDSYNKGFDYYQITDQGVNLILSKLPQEATIALDVGCGTGQLARQLHAAGLKVTAVDLSDTAIAKAKEQSPPDIDFGTLDIENDSLKKLGTFDLITLKLVFAFIDDKNGLTAKLKGLLNPKGSLVIINPVITDIAKATDKDLRISVDDDITMRTERFGFILASRTATPLSDHRELVTYVFQKSGKP